jgi:hypothetical protein
VAVVTIRYEFSQHFRVPAAEAFKWLTDYSPRDHVLMGYKGDRKVTRISDDTVILDDTLYPDGKAIHKKKLIKTDKKRLSYYNIHLTGPTKNSLYTYEIVPDGDGESRLDYTGYEVFYPRKAPTKMQLAVLAADEEVSWTRQWGLLAKAMERELRRKRS